VTDSQPTENTVFLVSGGARGITAQCVVALAERYRSRFILVGRSILETGPEAPWAVGQDEAALKRAAMAHLAAAGERPTPRQVQRLVGQVTAQREIRETLAAVAAAGGQAVYIAADVMDAEALQAAVADGSQQLGAPSPLGQTPSPLGQTPSPLGQTPPMCVTGIIHGAGVLADRLVQDKPLADFERVVAVKVAGLQALLACVPEEQLEYLVLFSSVAGFYGNIGQSDYAAANEILNKAAHWVRARHPRCRALAVNWGPWDGGMVTPELKRQLALRDIRVIPIDWGAELLADLLTGPEGGATQVVVGDPMVPPQRHAPAEGMVQHIHRELTLEANPYLRDHVIGGSAVLPTVCAIGWMTHVAEQLYPGYRFFRVDDYRALKGIVFDDELANEYVLDLTYKSGDDPDALTLAAMIWSRSAQGRPRYHYQADLTLRRGSIVAPAIADVLPNQFRTALSKGPVIEGMKLYQEHTLFHGPSFRGVERVLGMNETGIALRVHLPGIPPSIQGQFPVRTFNPYVIDSQLQSLLIWATLSLGYAGLPLRINAGVVYRALRFDETTTVWMRVVSQTPRRLVADVFVEDEAGSLCMEVRGAEITLSERLRDLFLQNTLNSLASDTVAV
jgi:NAD(P)-dependent dehydrogenase (short-subunit alcohol dehydrogenase family)